MLSCLLIKSQSRSEIALLFFQYNSTIITKIADSVRTVLVTVIQASALYYDVITYDVIKLLPPREQGLPPCCPPCKMNLVTPLGVFRIFSREGAPIFDIISCCFFLSRIILKYIENEKGSRGSGGMLPRKMFENLHTVLAILALFKQFLGKFSLNFLLLNLSVSPNMLYFVCTFSIMRA